MTIVIKILVDLESIVHGDVLAARKSAESYLLSQSYFSSSAKRSASSNIFFQLRMCRRELF
jgi:hypothetical protein